MSQVSRIAFAAVIVLVIVITFLAVGSCLLITMNKCLKGNKSRSLRAFSKGDRYVGKSDQMSSSAILPFQVTYLFSNFQNFSKRGKFRWHRISNSRSVRLTVTTIWPQSRVLMVLLMISAFNSFPPLPVENQRPSQWQSPTKLSLSIIVHQRRWFAIFPDSASPRLPVSVSLVK